MTEKEKHIHLEDLIFGVLGDIGCCENEPHWEKTIHLNPLIDIVYGGEFELPYFKAQFVNPYAVQPGELASDDMDCTQLKYLHEQLILYVNKCKTT